jgi:hypothetical protein
MLDRRLLKVTLNLNGKIIAYEGLSITAIIVKNASDIQNTAEIRIANLDRDVRNELLTDGSPFNQTIASNNSITVEVGRESYGYTKIFQGDITIVEGGQAPDVWTTIRALTAQNLKLINESISSQPLSNYSDVAGNVAERLGLSLRFDTKDKQISNFNFTGGLTKVLKNVSEISKDVSAYIDDDELVVQDRFPEGKPVVTTISTDSGMVGLPEFIDRGVRIVVLVDPSIVLGSSIRLVSKFLPSANGDYFVYKLSYNIANRENQFYMILECQRKIK